MSEPAHLDISNRLTVENVVKCSRFDVRLEFKDADRKRIDLIRRQVMDSLNGSEERVYGFNTGFGDNRTRPTVPKGLRGVIQDNLILSHSAGYGAPIEAEVVRAALAVRARTLVIGNSGVRSNLLSALCSLYNSGLIPVVPRFGSVGASGDLAPLSHIVLPLMGRGRVFVDDREVEVDRPLLDSKGVERLSYRPSDESPGVTGQESTFGPKEGLALNNGTSFMAAWLALTVSEFENLLWHANLALAMHIEASCGTLDAYDHDLQAVRGHRWIQESADEVNGHLQGSDLVFRRGRAGRIALDARRVAGTDVIDSIQDDYCLRAGCVVHGTAMSALREARETVETEINSVTDNPVVIDGKVLSGSHFHGMPLALAADHLRAAMAIVGGISERRVAKVMNDRRNGGLPRHLVIGDDDGIKSGWMIAQYLCASMVNELKTRSMPYCVGNVTTGNDSEDYVSMGANACRAAHECVKVLRGILAVELATAARALLLRTQATESLDLSSSGASATASKLVEVLREWEIPVWHQDDRPLEPLIERCAQMIDSKVLPSRVCN